MRKPKTEPDEEFSIQAAFASLRRAAEEHFARHPSPKDAVAPEPFRVRTGAEQDLARAEITYKLQGLLCPDPARCAKHRCRRLGRCQELAEIASSIEAQRALVAKERAAATVAADAGPAASTGAGPNERSAAERRARLGENRGRRRRRRQRKH
jgi:hypothetical protein